MRKDKGTEGKVEENQNMKLINSPSPFSPFPMLLKNKTILITGGAGFIGSHLTESLVKENAKADKIKI